MHVFALGSKSADTPRTTQCTGKDRSWALHGVWATTGLTPAFNACWNIQDHLNHWYRWKLSIPWSLIWDQRQNPMCAETPRTHKLTGIDGGWVSYEVWITMGSTSGSKTCWNMQEHSLVWTEDDHPMQYQSSSSEVLVMGRALPAVLVH